MNARTQTRTATLAAMALTLALTASMAAAAPKDGAVERAKSTVACRIVANYTMSAWMAPAAMVLHSAGAWKTWNERMAEEGLAVAAEAEPQGVDWARESVVVLALGELAECYHMEMTGVRRTLSGTTLSLHMGPGNGGTSPALVLAMPKSAAARLKLACDTTSGLPELRTYPEASLAAAGDLPPTALATSWGAMKAEYR